MSTDHLIVCGVWGDDMRLAQYQAELERERAQNRAEIERYRAALEFAAAPLDRQENARTALMSINVTARHALDGRSALSTQESET